MNMRQAGTKVIFSGILITIFVFFLNGDLLKSTAMTLSGATFLLAGVYQAARGWPVALTTWLLGIVLFLGGLGVKLFLVAAWPLDWVTLALGLIGLYVFWKMLFKRDTRKQPRG